MSAFRIQQSAVAQQPQVFNGPERASWPPSSQTQRQVLGTTLLPSVQRIESHSGTGVRALESFVWHLNCRFLDGAIWSCLEARWAMEGHCYMV